MKKKIALMVGSVLGGIGLFPLTVYGAENTLDNLSTTVEKLFGGGGGSSDTIKLYFFLTLLTLVPMLLVLTTCFTRIMMVLSFVRSSLGTQQNPPNQVLIGLALFLTFFIMKPVYTEINKVAITPLLEDRISQQVALDLAAQPLKKFMLKETREKDIALFLETSGEKKVKNPEELPFTVVAPAFMISELRTAFSIGFLIFLPFLIIDMVVSSILMSMGMFMLSPVMISLPFKLLLFVLVDGWYLVVESLVRSFQ